MTRRPRGRAIIATIALTLGFSVAVPLLPGIAPAAQAAAITNFNPGYIISDAVMYNSASMSAAAVTQFIATQGAVCNATAGNTCLKNYVETTPTRPANTYCAGAYQGATNETAATIIYKAGVACGINPQVLLVTLQKEQSLILSTTGKPASTYSRALGFGCPDSAGGACSAEYAGFANQIYSAAQQFKKYAFNPTSYSFRAGATNNIRFHPNTACGSSAVFIQNQATASLYNYTPYQPNAAALAAGTGTGDACSSYGNRNFWTFFSQWFGLPTGTQTPIGVLDIVSSAGGGARVKGWAFDPDTSDPIYVDVYIDGAYTRSILTGLARPDVAAAYGGRGGNGGFDTVVPAAAGQHTVCAYAINVPKGGPNPQIGCKVVTVTNSAPTGKLESLTPSRGTLTVTGWAYDPDTTASVMVRISVDGAVTATVPTNVDRPDIAASNGSRPTTGFTTDVPAVAGQHSVCVDVLDSSTSAATRIACLSATVPNSPTLGAVTTMTTTAPSGATQVSATGWAWDADTTNPVTIQLTVDGTSVASGPASATVSPTPSGAARATVGWSLAGPITAGAHTVCAVAVDPPGNTQQSLGCQTLTAPNRDPVGNVESVMATTGGVTVRGWAVDFDTSGPVVIDVMINNVRAQSLTANVSRPDVPAANFNGFAHGFSATIPTASGNANVCLVAVNAPAGPNVTLQCVTVTVP